MDSLTIFGLAAVTAILVFYALGTLGEILRHPEAGHPDGAALAQDGVKLRILLLRAIVPSCRIKAPLQTNRQMAPPRYARQAKARGDYIWTPSQPRPASRSLARMDRFRSAKSSQDGRFLSKSRN